MWMRSSVSTRFDLKVRRFALEKFAAPEFFFNDVASDLLFDKPLGFLLFGGVHFKDQSG